MRCFCRLLIQSSNFFSNWEEIINFNFIFSDFKFGRSFRDILQIRYYIFLPEIYGNKIRTPLFIPHNVEKVYKNKLASLIRLSKKKYYL
mgnify:CR=1 FL=1